MKLVDRVAHVRSIVSHPNKTDRYIVIPNDAPAYQSSGAWGVYDTERCQWINFRETETEALRLLSALLQR